MADDILGLITCGASWTGQAEAIVCKWWMPSRRTRHSAESISLHCLLLVSSFTLLHPPSILTPSPRLDTGSNDNYHRRTLGQWRMCDASVNWSREVLTNEWQLRTGFNNYLFFFIETDFLHQAIYDFFRLNISIYNFFIKFSIRKIQQVAHSRLIFSLLDI